MEHISRHIYIIDIEESSATTKDQVIPLCYEILRDRCSVTNREAAQKNFLSFTECCSFNCKIIIFF